LEIENQTTHCISRQNELIGEFCHQCEQKRGIQRITIVSMIADFSSKWIGWDNKFLRAVKGLTIHPFTTVKE